MTTRATGRRRRRSRFRGEWRRRRRRWCPSVARRSAVWTVVFCSFVRERGSRFGDGWACGVVVVGLVYVCRLVWGPTGTGAARRRAGAATGAGWVRGPWLAWAGRRRRGGGRRECILATRLGMTVKLNVVKCMVL